jgi:hypothetical protein
MTDTNKNFTMAVSKRGKKRRIYTGTKELAEIDPELVLELAKTLLPVESIATIVGCHKDTLYARFGLQLQQGRENRKHSLVQAMWFKALEEKDTKMLIWLSKQHLGYKESMPEQAQQVNFNVYTNEVPK